MTLHIITRPTSRSPALDQALRLATENDAVLLSCDAVYDYTHAIDKPNMFVLQKDLLQRGLAADNVQTVDFEGFVALTEQHQTIQSWL